MKRCVGIDFSNLFGTKTFSIHVLRLQRLIILLSKGASQHNKNYNIGIPNSGNDTKIYVCLYIILNEYTLKRIN